MTMNIWGFDPERTRIEYEAVPCASLARLVCVNEALPIWQPPNAEIAHDAGKLYEIAYDDPLQYGFQPSVPGDTPPRRIKCPTTEGSDGSLPVELWEDDRKLGPNNATRDEIRTLGGGRFHVGLSAKNDIQLRFSSSDDSDARKNGRKYVLRCPEWSAP